MAWTRTKKKKRKERAKKRNAPLKGPTCRRYITCSFTRTSKRVIFMASGLECSFVGVRTAPWFLFSWWMVTRLHISLPCISYFIPFKGTTFSFLLFSVFALIHLAPSHGGCGSHVWEDQIHPSGSLFLAFFPMPHQHHCGHHHNHEHYYKRSIYTLELYPENFIICLYLFAFIFFILLNVYIYYRPLRNHCRSWQ